MTLFKNTYYNGPVTDHFDGNNFHNLSRQDRSFTDLLKWMITRTSTPWPEKVIVHPTKPPAHHEGIKPLITFINHATILLQWLGVNILFDPVWSERCSPFKRVGPKRVHRPGVNFEDLPQIDLILLSHNHYDHLDIDTLKLLNQKSAPLIVTGLGNRAILGSSFQSVVELDWWQDVLFEKDIKITYIPAQHFSARGIFDRNWALWGGFVLQSKGMTIYFAGDTGFCSVFAEVKERFGNIDLSFLPIGAFEARWFMKPAHMSPEDALDAHEILQSKVSVAIHFGTFRLSDEGIDVPVQLLESEMQRRGISRESFRVMKPGETFTTEARSS